MAGEEQQDVSLRRSAALVTPWRCARQRCLRGTAVRTAGDIGIVEFTAV
ncbi:hypothetical protein [Actinacidiphila sp. bgisy160]